MMKCKKYTVMLALSILFQMISGLTIHASPSLGWGVSLNGDAVSNSKFKIAITQEARGTYGKYNFEGSQALLTIASVSEKNDDDYVEATNYLRENPDGGTYVFEFYAKGTVQPASGATISIGENDFVFGDFEKEAAVAPSGDKSWYKYTKILTLKKQTDCKVSFKIYSRISGLIIDNVSVHKDGEIKNLILDGGFEDYEEPEQEYDLTEYRASNLMITPSQDSLILSWKNPVSKSLIGISVFDITGGKEHLIGDTIDTTSGKLVFYRAEGLESNKKYQYKIVFSYEDKGDFVYYLGGSTPVDYSFGTLGGWNVRRWQHGIATYFCPADCMIDTEVYKNGKSSLKISSNIDTAVKELKQDVYMYLERSVAMENGKRYKMTFWQKTQNFSGYFQFFINGQKWSNRESTFTEGVGSEDWIYTECELESAGTANLRFQIPSICEALWIDDLEFYELNDDGEPVGENLVADGGFENVVSTEVGKITTLTAESLNKKAKLSWDLPEDNYAGAAIYEEKFGKYEYRGNIAADVSSMEITNLQNGRNYKFKLVPYNEYRIYGQEVECEFFLEIPNYEFQIPELYKKDNEEWIACNSLTGAGEYKVSTKAKNNFVESGLDCEQIIAVYNGNILKKVYSTTDNLVAVGKKGSSKDIDSEGITINDGDRIKVFLMDSILTQNLYLSPISFE